ncbi:hypothetical protein F5884DRAFT_446114 [Xylogone sp. PMI_703]|nr:hypothetical protein F5884DRAFT_446114 [Xylogone sp. PMI_703]
MSPTAIKSHTTHHDWSSTSIRQPDFAVSKILKKRKSSLRRQQGRLSQSSRTTFCPARGSVAAHRRAIFDWYESNTFIDDGGDIYSLSWSKRINRWQEEFNEDIKGESLHFLFSSYRKAPVKLNLGAFFLVYPLPAFALWQVLQACCKVDLVVCGTTIEEFDEFKGRENFPLRYLQSNAIIQLWRQKLNLLSLQLHDNDSIFKQVIFERRLHLLLNGVEKLDDSMEALKAIFKIKENDARNSDSCFWLLEHVCNAVDKRCIKIKESLDHLSY